jgi:hypothetical protein
MVPRKAGFNEMPADQQETTIAVVVGRELRITTT